MQRFILEADNHLSKVGKKQLDCWFFSECWQVIN